MIKITTEEKKKYLSIFNSLEREFDKKKSIYKDIRDIIAIGTGFFDDDDEYSLNVKHEKLLDSEHIEYMNTLCSGLYGGLVNPSGQWFDILPTNPELHEDYDVLAYCYELRRRFEFLFHSTNFYQEFKRSCNEYPIYGYAPLLTEEDTEKVVRFTHFTCGEVFIGCDSFGNYNKLARHINFSSDQLVDAFGYDNLPKSAKQAYDSGDYETKFEVNSLICPNIFRNIKSGKNNNFKFVSLYWIAGDDNDVIFLKKSGYRQNPIAVFTWEKSNSLQVYPLGIGEAVLGDVRELQATSYRGSKNEAYLNDPAMVLHSSLGRKPILPGSVFYTDGDPQKMATEIRRVNSYLEEIENKKQRIKERIRKISRADIMMLFSSKDKDRMTAREVIAMTNEQTTLMGGVYLNARDALVKIFERVFSIGLRRGFFPKPPEAMGSGGLKVEFLSNLARAQKLAELGSLQDLLLYSQGIFQIAPEAIDNLDADRAFAKIVDTLAIDTTIRRNPIEVQRIRQQRSQQQQQQATLEQQSELAKAAKDASKAEVSQDNLLGQLMNQNEQGF